MRPSQPLQQQLRHRRRPEISGGHEEHRAATLEGELHRPNPRLLLAQVLEEALGIPIAVVLCPPGPLATSTATTTGFLDPVFGRIWRPVQQSPREDPVVVANGSEPFATTTATTTKLVWIIFVLGAAGQV